MLTRVSDLAPGAGFRTALTDRLGYVRANRRPGSPHHHDGVTVVFRDDLARPVGLHPAVLVHPEAGLCEPGGEPACAYVLQMDVDAARLAQQAERA